MTASTFERRKLGHFDRSASRTLAAILVASALAVAGCTATATGGATGSSPATNRPAGSASAAASVPSGSSPTATPSGPVPDATLYQELLTSPFTSPDLPSRVESTSRFVFADAPPTGFVDGVESRLAVVHDTAAITDTPRIDFWIMRTHAFALGFVADRRANSDQYSHDVIAEDSIAPGAYCTSSDSTCVAVEGRVIVWASVSQEPSGGSALSLAVPMLNAAISRARGVGV